MASVRKRTWTTAAGETKTAWAVDFTDTRGNRQRKHFHLKKEAENFCTDIRSQLKGGTYRPDAERVTVKEVCESFLEDCEARMRRNDRPTRKMVAVFKGHIHNYILEPERGIGRYKLSQLTARSVREFRDRVRDGGMTVSTTRHLLSTLHNALRHAVEQEWVAINVAHGLRVEGRRDEGAKRVDIPSKETLRRVIEAAPADFRLAIIFAASTGVRAGEQWAARWGDIGHNSGELTIGRRVDAYGQEGPPKSSAGLRTVPLSAELVARLREARLASPFKKADDLIFPNSKGKHTSHDNVNRRRFWPIFDALEATSDAPAPKRFHWHALRHFAVSCWIEAGMQPKTVQTFAGHSDLQTTMDRYGHLFPSDDHRKAMDTIAKGLFA